ncbi:MAG: ATP-binding protein [Brevundimonas sp.]|nr:ATP-binding protein [Brevundimonas sp.]
MSARSPIDPTRYLGTVIHVTANQVQVNLPHATAQPERRGLALGAVGDFVFVDCGRVKILGRITETKIPDGERLSVEPALGRTPPSPNPIGRIQLLATVEQGTNRLQRGLPYFPRIGDGVYLADPELFAQLIRNAVARPEDLTLLIGTIETAEGVEVRIPPEKIFGRHCGVFGATGGGKSWTLATLIHELKAAGGKAIVFDPTGEFADIDGVDEVFVFENAEPSQRRVHFPYRQITEDDLFSLFRPSGQSQGPRLREAVKSLKLVQALAGQHPPGLSVAGGLLEKVNRQRAPYFAAVGVHAATINLPNCDFDISKLAEQIKQECVWATGNVAGCFGGVEQNALGHCETLVARINALLHSKELECLFGDFGESLVSALDTFIANDHANVALISFKDVRFEHGTREVLLNIIGRYLLSAARGGVFRDNPVVLFLDEAHQFLGRSIGDEYANVKLDAFGIIAKEGRKYGLTCVLATQRPRDIPQDVLSQLGTLFVHRLTNDQDRETVERACGDLDKAAAQFIPMLAPGEAVLIGPDLPAPVPVFITRPPSPPNSTGPSFQEHWRRRREAPRPAPEDPEPVVVAQVAVTVAPASASSLPAPGVAAQRVDIRGLDPNDEIPF